MRFVNRFLEKISVCDNPDEEEKSYKNVKHCPKSYTVIVIAFVNVINVKNKLKYHYYHKNYFCCHHFFILLFLCDYSIALSARLVNSFFNFFLHQTLMKKWELLVLVLSTIQKPPYYGTYIQYILKTLSFLLSVIIVYQNSFNLSTLKLMEFLPKNDGARSLLNIGNFTVIKKQEGKTSC